MDVTDRNAAADRIAANFAATKPPSETAGRTEDEIMHDTIADNDLKVLADPVAVYGTT